MFSLLPVESPLRNQPEQWREVQWKEIKGADTHFIPSISSVLKASKHGLAPCVCVEEEEGGALP